MALDKDELYDRINADEDMSDEEKREAYFSEVENDEMEQYWEDQCQQ